MDDTNAMIFLFVSFDTYSWLSADRHYVFPSEVVTPNYSFSTPDRLLSIQSTRGQSGFRAGGGFCILYQVT